MTLAELRGWVLDLPGVAERTAHGVHSFTVRRRLFLRLKDGGETLVLRTDRFERDHLLATAPEAFFVDERIREHPWVFVRLGRAEPVQLRALVHDAWRRVAPARLVADFDRR